MIKTRIFPESNYKSFFVNGKTIRVAIDKNLPITELKYPEFYDVKITGYCEGNCDFCYMDSSNKDLHYENIIEKIHMFFGNMNNNEKPYQTALGGGETTSHPEFISILKTFYDLEIVPNYTTNGMFDDDNIIKYTKKYCGSVALSCHSHLEKYWKLSAQKFVDADILTNFHIIISDKKSIDYCIDIYNNWKDKIKYFVLLPHISQGRASEKQIEWEYLLNKLPEDKSQFAFGAKFYPYLLQGNHNIKVSLYEPEILSKFLDMKDMKIYPSSFDME